MNKIDYSKLKQKSQTYSPSDLVDLWGFNEVIHIACEMLKNEEWDESLQEYATILLEKLKNKYPEKWDTSWRYDALLGYAYNIILKYEERYAAYKRAFDKVHPPPPELLVAMARCCIAPGKPPITEKEAIALVKQAITTKPYIEAVELLRGLYKSTGNVNEQMYWEHFLESTKECGFHLPPLDQIPNQ